MRSRISRVLARVSVLGAAAVAALLVAAGGAAAETSAMAIGPTDSLSTPVGLAAVGLGVAGMVAGVFRKKKIQPENQRKS